MSQRRRGGPAGDAGGARPGSSAIVVGNERRVTHGPEPEPARGCRRDCGIQAAPMEAEPARQGAQPSRYGAERVQGRPGREAAGLRDLRGARTGRAGPLPHDRRREGVAVRGPPVPRVPDPPGRAGPRGEPAPGMALARLPGRAPERRGEHPSSSGGRGAPAPAAPGLLLLAQPARGGRAPVRGRRVAARRDRGSPQAAARRAGVGSVTAHDAALVRRRALARPPAGPAAAARSRAARPAPSPGRLQPAGGGS